MTVLEFLDRIGERRAKRPQRRPRDIRQFIGFAFLAGYYIMVYQFTRGVLPPANVDLIRDAMLTLGPPIGIIIGAMFRTDAREEQATENTGEAFRTIRDAMPKPAVETVTTTTETVTGAPAATTAATPTIELPATGPAAGTEAAPLKMEIVNTEADPANVRDHPAPKAERAKPPKSTSEET